MPSTPRGATDSVSPEEKLVALGLSLPLLPPAPVGTFANCVRIGTLLFVSGQGPVTSDGRLMTGKVGAEVSAAEAYEHARLAGLNLLAVTREQLGSLKGVRRVVKLLGMVNATPGFGAHPQVINGCSDLFSAVFGAEGVHARSSVGMGSLPNNITVEIEAIFEVDAA